MIPPTMSQDHPRRCGEHFYLQYFVLQNLGSSPQMRGALFMKLIPSLIRGIIPADAGSTDNGNVSTVEQQDHPRRCGEHTT